MARIDVGGGLRLGYRVWGDGSVPVAFVHGNLASKDWFELAAAHLPDDLRVVGIDWRGSGDSDRPPPGPDYADYAPQVHARDMLTALDRLGIGRCHLATHSTSGLIALHMDLMAPGRFPRMLALAPVPPGGLAFDAAAMAVFRAMMADKGVTRRVMAKVAPSLFIEESLAGAAAPAFVAPGSPRSDLFERVVEQAQGVAEGIWLGTPFHLNRAAERGGLVHRLSEITAEHLILWGERDLWIRAADLEAMAAGLPRARLAKLAGIGHAMNLEAPELYAGYVGAFFAGVPV
jgi:pimeloyl-ACP methyl ester carboxylesterase